MYELLSLIQTFSRVLEPYDFYEIKVNEMLFAVIVNLESKKKIYYQVHPYHLCPGGVYHDLITKLP